ncbi:prepilin peptidase [Photobacterium rosenbergii]|uniref:prepilin peptidase n=1 Tax=Photobacterium rosenbergii TaxID=294936 RepID=UPI001C98FA6F|nr:prepilin peptidase [Photobacterium rosenbergii]MBY5946369.1 prepilin peptidase [Photobacterium rosenbergii]
MSTPILLIVFYAALYDIKHCKIPNKVIFILLSFGMVQVFININGFDSNALILISNAILGLIVSLTVSLALYNFGLFGAGDAKLLASLGIFVGPYNSIILIAISIIFSGLLALCRLACYGELKEMLVWWYRSFIAGHYFKPQSNTIAISAVPMGGAILLATVYCHFYLF